MSMKQFIYVMEKLSAELDEKPVDTAMEQYLNQSWSANSPQFTELKNLCHQGEEQGWLMAREAGGIRFGRAIKAGTSAGSFSVDVVRMRDIKGPHHIHPNGEIGAVMTIDGAPTFDGKPEGWYVYEPGSSHQPTVSGGDAYVLYLLPEGAITFI